MISVSQRKKYHNEKNFIKIIDSMQYFLCIISEKLGNTHEKSHIINASFLIGRLITATGAAGEPLEVLLPAPFTNFKIYKIN